MGGNLNRSRPTNSPGVVRDDGCAGSRVGHLDSTPNGQSGAAERERNARPNHQSYDQCAGGGVAPACGPEVGQTGGQHQQQGDQPPDCAHAPPGDPAPRAPAGSSAPARPAPAGRRRSPTSAQDGLAGPAPRRHPRRPVDRYPAGQHHQAAHQARRATPSASGRGPTPAQSRRAASHPESR